MTLRDKVWNQALRRVHENGKFTIGELDFSDSQMHTVRRVLKQMEEQGWLERESAHAKIWRVGPTARERMTVEDTVLEAAKA